MGSIANHRSIGCILLAMLCAVATSGAAQAAPGTRSAPSAEPTRATATLGFRIVIHEVLGLDARLQARPAHLPAPVRTVTVHADRQLVTLASP